MTKTAQHLHRMMQDHNINAEQLAGLLGVPPNTLRNWLAGTRAPNSSVLRLLQVFDMLAVLAPDLHAQFIPARVEPKPLGRPRKIKETNNEVALH